MNLKYEKIIRNMAFHNIVAHPLMQILSWVGKNELANRIHDNTLPKKGVEEKGTANTENDVPEVNRILKG
tara:strand:- start:3238 stop:3447 length:210 start_codon:yes stop_codon:yes gene_type:complete